MVVVCRSADGGSRQQNRQFNRKGARFAINVVGMCHFNSLHPAISSPAWIWRRIAFFCRGMKSRLITAVMTRTWRDSAVSRNKKIIPWWPFWREGSPQQIQLLYCQDKERFLSLAQKMQTVVIFHLFPISWPYVVQMLPCTQIHLPCHPSTFLFFNVLM